MKLERRDCRATIGLIGYLLAIAGVGITIKCSTFIPGLIGILLQGLATIWVVRDFRRDKTRINHG